MLILINLVLMHLIQQLLNQLQMQLQDKYVVLHISVIVHQVIQKFF